MKENKFKIIRFVAKNANGLKAVEITPDGDIVQLTGKNGAGKTSVIDTALQVLHGGLELLEGSESGKGELDISNGSQQYRISREAKNGKPPVLSIHQGEGFDLSVKRPSEFLRGLVGENIIDYPLMFVNKSGKERKAIVFGALGIDTSIFDTQIEELEGERQVVNKRIMANRSQLNLQKPDDSLPKDELLISELVVERDQAEALNRDISTVKIAIAEETRKITMVENQLSSLKEGLKTLNANLAEYDGVNIPDLTVLTEKIANAEETNQNIRMNNVLIGKAKELDADKTYYTELGDERKTLESQKQGAISDLLPIPGITIEEDDVYWNGVPGSKWSTGESMYIGCAMRVAQVDKSQTNVVFVDDVSLLDEEILLKMRELLGDFQIWEIFNQIIGDPINVITIEDGMVK